MSDDVIIDNELKIIFDLFYMDSMIHCFDLALKKLNVRISNWSNYEIIQFVSCNELNISLVTYLYYKDLLLNKIKDNFTVTNFSDGEITERKIKNIKLIWKVKQ